METALWTTQLLLAAIFFATGLTKLTQPRAQLAAGPMGWAADVTDSAGPAGPPARPQPALSIGGALPPPLLFPREAAS